jgi:hypothetical protein
MAKRSAAMKIERAAALFFFASMVACNRENVDVDLERFQGK